MDQSHKSRILKITAWITGILALISAGLAAGWSLGGITMLKAFSVMFIHNPSEEASIGIIGGADGPTAIYLSGIPPIDFFLWLCFGILAAAASLCALLSRRLAKRK